MVKKELSCILVTALLLAFSTVSFAAAQYTVTNLGTLPYSWDAQPWGLNSLGHVVGEINVRGSIRAFLWKDGQMHVLEPLSGYDTSSARGINDRGEIAGQSGDYLQSSPRACLWRNGGLEDLGTLTGSSSSAYAINNLGQIVGASSSHPVMWENGNITDLLPANTTNSPYMRAISITDGGRVCGQYSFVWENGVITGYNCTIPGGLSGYSYATSMNDYGQMVGVYVTQSFKDRAYIRQNGVMTDMGIFAGDYSCVPYCINSSGIAVGVSRSYTSTRAFVWKNGIMTDLNTLIASNSGWSLTNATAINTGGQIVGAGYHNGTRSAFLLTPVPEPTGICALLVSLSGMGIMLRRKARC